MGTNIWQCYITLYEYILQYIVLYNISKEQMGTNIWQCYITLYEQILYRTVKHQQETNDGKQYMAVFYRVATEIFVFMFSRKFCEIISFVFREIFLQFREIFAKYEIEICAKFSRNSKEISQHAKQEITLTGFF